MAKPTDPLALWADLLAERTDLAPVRDCPGDGEPEELHPSGCAWAWMDVYELIDIATPDFAPSSPVSNHDALAHLRAHAAMKVAASGWWIDERTREDGSTYWQAFNISIDNGGLFEVDSYDAALVSALTSAFPKKGGT